MVHIGNFDLGMRPGIVAVISADAPQTALRAREMGADILEVRADLLGIRDADEFVRMLDELKVRTGLPVIATSRCTEEGGRWRGSEEARLDMLVRAAHVADAVDVELAARGIDTVKAAVRSAGRTLIISTHDFRGTPSLSSMLEILERSRSLGADIAKLAFTPVTSADTLRLLEAANQCDFPVCVIAMGKLGTHTRVVGHIYGSVLTYGAVDAAVAPGQLRIDELKYILDVLA